MNVDTIHVLADGRVVEQGTHHELISKEDSVYSEMWRNYLREADEHEEQVIIEEVPQQQGL
jgi:ABC-type dipeptide/oligopeptide/nickel transport system ATPase component